MLKILSELNRQKFAQALVLVCIILTAYNSSFGAATRGAGRTRQGRGREPREDQSSPGQQAQEQKRQQATENAATSIDTDLVDMLSLINQGQRPNKDELTSAQDTIDKSRKYIKQFQDNMVCQFMMLNAWTNYFDAGAKTALSPANQAYRKNNSNNDARATQAAIALLAGQKPLIVRAERQQTQQEQPSTGQRSRSQAGGQERGRSRRQGQDTTSGRGRGGRGAEAGYGAGTAGTYSGTASSGSILNLDTDSIKVDWLGRKVGQFRLDCINGTTFSYNPAESNLCILFWKLATAEDSVHDDSSSAEEEEGFDMRRVRPQGEGTPYPTQSRGMGPAARVDRFSQMGARPGLLGDEPAPASDPVSAQMSALGNLFSVQFQNPDVKFIAININNPEEAPAVVARLLKSPGPWAQAILDNVTATSAFKTLNLEEITSAQPLTAIVDKTGTVRYAGPAAGFLAPMMVDDLLSRNSELSPADSFAITDDVETIDGEILEPSANQEDELPGQTPVTAPAMTEYVPTQTRTTGVTDLTPEDFQAQKLLAYAKGLFIPAGQKKFLTSKTGVDLCRQIIRDYPNTTYADEARKLLRTVPPNEQKRYNITPEEMGL
jgi:hypothetical protein